MNPRQDALVPYGYNGVPHNGVQRAPLIPPQYRDQFISDQAHPVDSYHLQDPHHMRDRSEVGSQRSPSVTSARSQPKVTLPLRFPGILSGCT